MLRVSVLHVSVLTEGTLASESWACHEALLCSNFELLVSAKPLEVRYFGIPRARATEARLL